MPLYALVALAAAAPPAWDASTKPDGDVLTATWVDASKRAHAVAATFPPGTWAAAEPLRFDLREVMVTLADRLRAWARVEAPTLIVEVERHTLTLTADGRSAAEAQRTLEASQARKDALYAELLAERRLQRIAVGHLRFDHARIAAESAPLVRPLAVALGPADDPRAYAARALTLVQAIPYEQVTHDTFAPPLAILEAPVADCDEKAVLYASLLRAVTPTLPIAILTMEDHALVGLGLPARPGERTVAADGVEWLVAEPAGPALHGLGTLDRRTERGLVSGFTVDRVP